MEEPSSLTAETSEKSNASKLGSCFVGASEIHSTCSKHRRTADVTFCVSEIFWVRFSNELVKKISHGLVETAK